uniref:Uncharacterized protein n=1 Tax=Peronospora matthiolae TaxID=2874970 RepID=A0AAV1VHQ6_9STRA
MKAQMLTFPSVLLDAPRTSDEAAFQPARAQELGVPGASAVRAVRDSTVESCSQSSQPVQHAQWQPLHPAGHRQPCSPPHSNLPGQPGRQGYHRNGQPPLVDAVGQKHWTAEHLLGHEDPRRDFMRARFQPRASNLCAGSGFYPSKIRGNFRSSLLQDVPDVVKAYESVDTPILYASDNVCVLVANENETIDDGVVVKCQHDDETKSDDDVVMKDHYDHDHESVVVMNLLHHDYDKESVVENVHHHEHESAIVVVDMHHDHDNEIVVMDPHHDH